ncbi:MAG: HD domain-containing phosphohydrolase [Smithella sp.]
MAAIEDADLLYWRGITLNNEERIIIKLSINSFRVKVMLALILSMILLVVISGFLLNKSAWKGQLKQLRNQLLTVAQISALSVDADLLKRIPCNRDGINTIPYKRIDEHLKAILHSNNTIKDIYIMTKTEQEGTWQFIADIDTPNTTKERPKAAFPGDRYNAARFPQMLKGYDGPSADQYIETDEWGASLSGYAPIKDNRGETVAVLGVDITADVLLETERNIKRNIWFILIFGLIASIILGVWLSAMISRRVVNLVEGTHHVADGDLQYRVNIKGNDEIGQLAKSFNLMTESLLEARKKLNDYFMRIVQSLVLSLEAKDVYTAGHSVRVAEYAAQIAARIGLPAEKVEELKEAALLHDIGKLGISENILNKNGPLTPPERTEINNHPAVGGKILKPVFLNEEMLTAITGHHERYDGTGCPNGLAGEQISIYARITAVADTYDAMTSTRAYRPNMGKEWAIGELEKGKGTQFDPRIVDVFIEILREELRNTAPTGRD